MAEENRKRIGIMGGTFDPIHVGHLILAECAYEQFSLDTVLFMPSGNPPHKQQRDGCATDYQRMKMVSLAIEDNPHFTLDTGEMLRTGFTYTNETLQMLHRSHPDTDYYFIIGADSLMAFSTWKHPEIICQNCILLVAVRNHLEISVMEEKMAELRRIYGARIYLLHSTDLEVSSTTLRQWCRQGRSLRYYIPDPVWDYITENHVYSNAVVAKD